MEESENPATITLNDGSRTSKPNRNAVTHGIFARVVLPGRESSKEYRRLVRALRDDLRPVGTLEELHVQQLAWLYWRLRRIAEAESAEILKARHCVRWDHQRKQAHELKTTDRPLAAIDGGLLKQDSNPLIIGRCIAILKSLHNEISENGLDLEANVEVLGQIYGCESLEMTREELPGVYGLLTLLLEEDDKTREELGLTPEKAKKRILKGIDAEIERLTQLEETAKERQSKLLKHELGTQMVPLAPERSERLIRYEVMLSHEIEKTLNRLERLQRRRLGKGDLPPIKLDVST